MKILKIAHGVYPYGSYGVEIYVHQLSKALVDRGHQVRVLIPDKFRDQIPVAQPGFEIGFLPLIYGGQPAVNDALRGVIADWKPDVIHLHHARFAGRGVVDFLDQTGVPSGITLHDYWFLCPGVKRMCGGSALKCVTECSKTSPLRARRFLKNLRDSLEHKMGSLKALRRSKVPFITLSRYVKNVFCAQGLSEDRFTVIPGGVEVNVFRQVVAKAGSHPVRIAYLGALMREKGIRVFMDAMKKVKGSARFVIHGYDVDGFWNQIKKNYEGGYELYGLYDYSRAPEIMAEIDVLVLPSLWEETYGLVVQEALAARKIVVVSDRGAFPERIKNGENGFVVPAGDTDALAKVLSRIVESFETLSRQLNYELSVHDISVDAQKHEALYEKWLCGKSGSAGD